MSSTGGWYPDPHDPSRVRWWDGEWTEHVRDRETALAAVSQPAGAAAGAQPEPVSVASNAPQSTATAAPPQSSATIAPPQPTATMAPRVPMPPARSPSAPAPPSAPVSIGQALLPPLATEPSTTTLSAESTTTEAPDDSGSGDTARAGRSPIRIAIAVLAVALAAFAALWAAGVVKSDDAKPVSSAPGQVAFDGPGYALALPQEWQATGTDLPANVDAAYTVPGGAQVTVGSVKGDAAAAIAENDAVARQAAFDTLVRLQQAVYPDVAVVSREPATLAGAPGERIILEGPGPAGTPVRLVELVALHDGMIVFLGLEGAPDAVTAAQPAFDNTAASFRFDG